MLIRSIIYNKKIYYNKNSKRNFKIAHLKHYHRKILWCGIHEDILGLFKSRLQYDIVLKYEHMFPTVLQTELSSPNSKVEAPTSNVTVFGDWAFRR